MRRRSPGSVVFVWTAMVVAGALGTLASGARPAVNSLPAGVEAIPLPARPLVTAILDPDNLGGPESAIAYEHARRAGARFARLMLNWADVAPRGPRAPAGFRPQRPGDPLYRWGRTDREVRQAIANGFVPYVYVQTAPVWAQQDTCGTWGIGPCRPSPSALADFMTAAARRYGGGYRGLPRVRYWQVWNEPNLLSYLRPQVDSSHRPLSPELYRRMVNAAADALHAVNEDNVAIAGGMSPFGDHPPGDKIAPLLFMRKLLCLSVGSPRPVCRRQVRFDVWGHNPYTSGDPTHHANFPDDISLPDLWRMRVLLDAAARAGTLRSREPVGFWVTEFAWDTDPPDPLAVPEKLHARWVAEALYRMWSQGVSVVTWFLIRDQAFRREGPFQSALYFHGPEGIASDKPKLALTAFRFPFVAFREPKRKTIMFWGRSPAGRAEVSVERQVSEEWRVVTTLSPNRYGIFSGRFAGTARTGFLRARLVNGRGAALPFSLVVPPDRPGCTWGTC